MPEIRKPRHLGVLALAWVAAAVTACGPAGSVDPADPKPAAPTPDSPAPTTAPATPTPSPTPTPAGPPEFTAKVSRVTAKELGASWRSGCPVGPSGLRKVTMTYWGFDKKAHTGELIVNRVVTDDVVDIFGKLYEWRFPITRMENIAAYRASDFDSIDADNTSAFNCRQATGGTSWSKHSFGQAIDLNPRENPWVEPDGSVAHTNARRFADRPLRKPGVVNDGDRVVDLFADHGWEWGGYFNGAKDYQHFSKGGG
ncbi:M15 family metallopeptidase [Sphaerisporangium aureirubrum]|uniref:M15 family metallopeptidase n=1 Tax=Sphaerisporangium aureirubrum TaxID=1544736 RepID=A0ABW1NTT6_9ACTN